MIAMTVDPSWLQILWFAQHLRTSRWRAALHASRAMVEALAVFVVFSLIFA